MPDDVPEDVPDDVPDVPGMAEGEPISEDIYGQTARLAVADALDTVLKSGAVRKTRLTSIAGATGEADWDEILGIKKGMTI